jgi:hypothetical protein
MWAEVAQSVGKFAIGWRIRGSNPGGWGEFPHPSRPALGLTQPPVKYVPGLLSGVSRPGRGVDHPPPSSAKFKERVQLDDYCILTEVLLNLTEVLTLTEVFPCFFLSCKANARVKLAKTGHDPPSSVNVVICVVWLLFVLFYVLFVCKWVLPPWDNPIAVNKYIISYHIISLYHIS